MSFSNNVGSLDRIIRILAAIALLAFAALSNLSNTLMIGLIVVAIILSATALISFCPLYAVLKLRTNKKDSTV